MQNPNNGGKVVEWKGNPDELPDVVCGNPECGGTVFIQAQRIKKVSALLSPDGTARYIQTPVGVCLKCSTPLPLRP